MRITGTKVGPGLYTYAAGRFTVRLGRVRLAARWEVLDSRGGGSAVASKAEAVNWIIRRLADERAAELEEYGDKAGPTAAGTPRPPSRQCTACAHLGGLVQVEKLDPRLETVMAWSCSAFPGGIPEKITEERHDHRKEHAGDAGIRFEARPDADAEAVHATLFGGTS